MPRVSVIVPCFNEQATIQLLLEAIYTQTYRRDDIEVIIADGMSEDQTRQRIAEFQVRHPDLDIQVVDNPRRNIPAGLNCAIRAAQGEIIIRLDAHCMPRPDYIIGCISALEQGKGDNVGGVWEIQPGGAGWQARAIAVAAAHPLGVGDASYRYTETAQQVDTVPFGAYRRSLVEKIGFYDENLLTNEDYEFNVRVRQSGGTVWLDPAIRSAYFARDTLIGLIRQYARYGHWKARMLRRYPGTLRWRQALPPAFVASVLISGLLALFFPIFGVLFVIELCAYALILLLAGFSSAWKHSDPALVPGVPLAIASMHLAWGSAFLWSIFVR
ncbi:MAG: glycosyl transferase [Chloroflexi bacterium RBG_16_57_11]|nr:MAG: glycosyl transferase [Chloroflexi bacterium RBG_16_57_11]